MCPLSDVGRRDVLWATGDSLFPPPPPPPDNHPAALPALSEAPRSTEMGNADVLKHETAWDCNELLILNK